MTATLLWRGTVTAASSISHGGETRGTISLLRRELIAQPGGDPAHVPVISGNAARGILRRLSEELMRDAVGYEHQLPLAAAHVLRGGGALVKTGAEPLSGRRLAELRALLPHLALFGAATGGRIIDGCLQVGKVVPVVTETTHITGHATTLEAFDATQIETYIRHDDGLHHTTETLRDDLPAAPDRGLDPTVDPAPDPAAEPAAETPGRGGQPAPDVPRGDVPRRYPVRVVAAPGPGQRPAGRLLHRRPGRVRHPRAPRWAGLPSATVR